MGSPIKPSAPTGCSSDNALNKRLSEEFSIVLRENLPKYISYSPLIRPRNRNGKDRLIPSRSLSRRLKTGSTPTPKPTSKQLNRSLLPTPKQLERRLLPTLKQLK